MSMLRVVLTAACGAVLMSSCNPQSPRFAFTSAERRGVIESNGLRFIIMPDTTTKLAEVDVHYDVGSREDPQGKAGLASSSSGRAMHRIRTGVSPTRAST